MLNFKEIEFLEAFYGLRNIPWLMEPPSCQRSMPPLKHYLTYDILKISLTPQTDGLLLNVLVMSLVAEKKHSIQSLLEFSIRNSYNRLFFVLFSRNDTENPQPAFRKLGCK